MGEQISLLHAGTSHSDVSAFLVELSEIELSQQGDFLAENRLFKTAKCVKENQGQRIVKIYIKRGEAFDADLSAYEQQFEDICAKLTLSRQPNLIAGEFIETLVSPIQKIGAISRQYFWSSLRGRYVRNPELKPIEKLWLAYQLLQAVKQLHEANVCHGDIKAENVMLTSWQWVFLT
jgi:phosphoinositide-3-kinase regulatory subunit 4